MSLIQRSNLFEIFYEGRWKSMVQQWWWQVYHYHHALLIFFISTVPSLVFFKSTKISRNCHLSQSCTGWAHQQQRGLLVWQDEEHVGEWLCGDDEAVDGQEHYNLINGCWPSSYRGKFKFYLRSNRFYLTGFWILWPFRVSRPHFPRQSLRCSSACPCTKSLQALAMIASCTAWSLPKLANRTPT